MRVPMRGTGAERPVVAMKSGKPDGVKGSRHSACAGGQLRMQEERPRQAKQFCISKWLVWEAYQRVRANQGAPGVDSESIEVFEEDLKNNLYRIWNRMSSGTYFPPSGKNGWNTEEGRRREASGHTHGFGQGGPNGSQDVPGAVGGAEFSS